MSMDASGNLVYLNYDESMAVMPRVDTNTGLIK